MLALAGVLALLAGVAGGFALSGRSLPFLGGGGAAVAADTTDAEDAIPAASPSRAPTSTEGTDQTSPATASTMIPTTTDPTTSTTMADSSSSTSTTVPGDLDLSVPMARPECDGSYATFIGASVTPEDYGSEISGYLERYPDSNYLRTDITCSSLRSRTEDGEIIYAVFLGPFDTFDQACSATSRGPAGSYVKRLDDVSDPNEIPEC